MLHVPRLKPAAVFSLSLPSQRQTVCRTFQRRYAQAFGLLPKDVVERARRVVAATPGLDAAEGDGERDPAKRPIPEYDAEAMKKKRRTEWKRRQGRESFLDHVIIHVRAGKGGNGCVAFHREKFKPYGPPSGGNGGGGGDVYIQPTPHLTTLSSVSTRVRAEPGGNGQGTWQNGRNAPPTIIKVPLGTIVRQLPHDDPRRTKNEFEAEEEALEGLEGAERMKKFRQMRWVHYPDYEDDNIEGDFFKEAEKLVYKDERERRLTKRLRANNLVYLDLDKVEETQEALDPNRPLGLRKMENHGHLVARGGMGGYGNPHFLTADNRSPKFAMRGTDGERISLSLELKLLADVGLVGMPNAGKSTFLKAITGGRARTEVAGYAFTTLNPIVGVVRVRDDGSFEGVEEGTLVEETRIEEEREREMLDAGGFADALTRNQKPRHRPDYDSSLADTRQYGEDSSLEIFRFTVADNPGLISQASDNVGLGHSFLRSIERSPALVYVVDLSGPAPWDELAVLKEELEKYKPGMSGKARLVIANKADLLGVDENGQPGDQEAVTAAKEKLARLEEFVKNELSAVERYDEGETVGERQLDVVPISARFSLNLRKVVKLMRGYVAEARSSQLTETQTQ